jgi:GDP-L-fucose synthase
MPRENFFMWTMPLRESSSQQNINNKPEPVNLGSGEELSMRELANLICELSAFDGSIAWDTSRPNGQPRRCLDTTRAEREFGFKARTKLRNGLIHTIEWYERTAAGQTAQPT